MTPARSNRAAACIPGARAWRRAAGKPTSMRLLRSNVCVGLAVIVVAFAGCGSENLRGAPNVKGLALPDAKAQLQQAGFSASVKSDATFGVIIESHFTVCNEHTPVGKLVPLDVSKQC